MLCVPLVSKDVLLGVIQVMNRVDGRPFDDRQLRLAQILADHTAIAMENARLFRQLEDAAVTDDLTGLGNARRLNRLLPQRLPAVTGTAGDRLRSLQGRRRPATDIRSAARCSRSWAA
jgi:GAF domain-containing protein